MDSVYLPWYILATAVVYLMGIWLLLALLHRSVTQGKAQ